MATEPGKPRPVIPPDASAPQSRWSVRPGLAAVFGFLATLSLLLGTMVADAQYRERQLSEDTAGLLDVFAARTQERINAYFGLLDLLRTEAVKSDTAPEILFQQRAQAIVDQFPGYQALTVLSPDGIIQNVFPIEGNESALGLDVTRIRNAADAIAFARETGELGVTGPIDLAQGGLGFVGYLPIDGHEAGIVAPKGFFSAVFRVNKFIEPLLNEALRENYTLQVTDAGDTVFSLDSSPDMDYRATTRIRVGQRIWIISLTPRPEQLGSGLSVQETLVAAIFAAFIVALIFFRLAHGASIELQSRADAWLVAHTTALTGLPNRYSLLKRLSEFKEEEVSHFAMALLDLQQLRLVNAIHGQDIADRMIQWVGARLVTACPNSSVFHLEGGEFAVINEMTRPAQSLVLAEQLQSLVNQHVNFDDIELDVGGQVGFVYVETPTDGSEVLSQAGAALVRAKERGGPQVYDQRIREEAQTHVFMESELRLALMREQLHLHFQPICRLDTETPEVRGFEALIRWEHPELGPVRPDIFIPIAESSGLIEEIGRWVLRKACLQIAEWRKRGFNFRVGVNISPRQMLDRSLKTEIMRALKDSGAPAELLIIEITESLAIRNLDSAVQMLDELREIGITVALDDFGTGYSSLSYLNRLPIDILKLDRVLISNIESEQQPLEITRGMIALAHAIGLSVVAEGVETAGQLDLLRELGCDYAQGYFFSRPVPAAEAIDTVTSVAI